jgi:inhibitor of cysteine peptidase
VISVDQSVNGQTIDLPVGQVMELRLAENPTTGYRWTFVTDGKPVCVVVADQFQRPSGPPGAGGEHSWQIKGVAVGVCDIALRYGRSFEPNAPGKSFDLHVHVTP